MIDDSMNTMGNIFISHKAIATIASHSALESYGVVGLARRLRPSAAAGGAKAGAGRAAREVAA